MTSASVSEMGYVIQPLVCSNILMDPNNYTRIYNKPHLSNEDFKH